MASFPALRTSASVQYPFSTGRAFETRVIRFLGGGEQRFRVAGATRRAWEIRLDLLNDSELSAVMSFFEEQRGRDGSFSFTDPSSGNTYDDCSFASDTCAASFREEGQAEVVLMIKENRG